MRTSAHAPPGVDERIVMPESGFEIIDGELLAVSPAHEPHGSRHSKLAALLEAHVGADHSAAIDMLTRTSVTDDFAPDASVYPTARDPETGGRQIEALAFEVVSTESLAHAGKKAAKLIERGVRRVFAIDVERQRGLEWSARTNAWEILADDSAIDDPALCLALPIHDLVAVASTDDAVARALLAKRNAVLVAAIATERNDAKAEGKAESILAVLVARGIPPTADQRQAILAIRDSLTLDRALAKVASCTSADLLLAELE